MAHRITLAVGQFQCTVGDKDANLSKLDQLAHEAARLEAQLICFPEMAVTGFDPKRWAELAEAIPGPAVERLSSIARANNLGLIAGLPEVNSATGQRYNCCVLLDSQGKLIAHYRKRCLYLGEKEAFEPGGENTLLDFGPCRLAVTICYDYVFGQYIRQLVDAGAELICHPTAWLTTDVCERWHYSPLAYRAMGMTRALENTVFYLSANLWGNYDREGNLRAIGQSAIIAPWGEVLAEVPQGEGVAVATVDFDAAREWRQAVAPYLNDRLRYGF